MEEIPDYLTPDQDVRWMLRSTGECWDADLHPDPIPAGADPIWQPFFLSWSVGWNGRHEWITFQMLPSSNYESHQNVMKLNVW